MFNSLVETTNVFAINNYGIQNIGGSNCGFDYGYLFRIQKLGKIRIGITTERDWNQTPKYQGIEIQGHKHGSIVPIFYWSQSDNEYKKSLPAPKEKAKVIQMIINDNKLHFRLIVEDSFLSIHDCTIERNNMSWYLVVNIDNKAILKLEKFIKTERKYKK